MKTLGKIVLACASFQISAQESSQEADYELVTTAMHTIRSETALPVTVLAGEELHDAARATIGETLAGQPGINNASFGPAVGQTVIRGQQGRRVMNLSNAIANADASGNSADHAVTVEPILADAIEVLRGPSTLLYGGGAIGGVVNVIDNRVPRNLPDKPVFVVESRHDSAADLTTSSGRLEFATGNLAWHFDGVRRQWNNLEIPGLAIDKAWLDDDSEEEENSNGYIANTGGETEAVTTGLSYIFANGFIGMAVNRIDNTYGLPPGAHGDEHGEEDAEHVDEEGAEHEEELVFIDMGRTRYDLTGEWRNLTPWIEHLDYRLAFTDYGHAEMEGPGLVGTRFSNDSWQQRLQITHRETAGLHGVLGLQTTDEEFGAIGEESFIPVTQIRSRGLFLVEDFHKDNFTLELGGRYNRDSYSPQDAITPGRKFSTVSYSAAGLWDISAANSLGLIYSHSQRAPSIEELYSNFGLLDFENCVIHFATSACETGDVNFSEEASNNIDITYYLEQDNWNATLTVFHNAFEDYIGQVATGITVDGFPVRAYRQMDARFSGLELDATFLLNDTFTLEIFADRINGRLDGNGDAPRMPPSRIGSRLNVSANNWSAYISLLHADQQDQPGNFEIGTDSYTRLDLGANVTFALGSDSEVLFFARASNLGDEEIRLATSYLRGFAPEAGQSLEAGFRFTY